MNSLLNKLFPIKEIFSGSADCLSIWIILVIIGITIFFLYRIGINLRNLNKIIYSLKNDFSEDKIANNTIFGNLWNNYRAGFISTSLGEKTKESAKVYFSLNNLLQNGTNLGSLGAAANILVGLGVLGTFLGLTVGISSMDMETPDSIKSSIDGLLAGIGTAFATSVWGMITSLIVTICEKHRQNKLRMNLHDLCFVLDTKFKMTPKDEYLLKLESDNKLFERYRMQQLGEQEYLKNLFAEYFSYSNDEGTCVQLPNLLRDNYRKLDEMAAAMSSFSTDLSLKIEAGFEAILQNESLQEILPALYDLKNEIISLGKGISSPAENIMTSVVEEIQKMTMTLMDDMRDTISDSTKEELAQISSLLAKSSVSLLDLPERLETMTQNLNSSFEEFKNTVTEVSSTAATHSSESVADMKHIVEEMSDMFSNKILELQQSQSEVMGRQAETVNSTDQLLKSFGSIVGDMKEVGANYDNVIKNIGEVQQTITSTSKELTSFGDVIQKSSVHFLESQNIYKKYSEAFLQENSKALEQAKEMIETSTQGTRDNVERFRIVQDGLKGIFEQVDNGLKQYQQTVENGIRSYLTGFTDSVKGVTDSLAAEASRQGDLLEELNEIVSKMKK